ncbi:uncharacterized protein CLUP02_09264 [Colletotrichum lupini]|uniref:Uncharacterized protein n=1 Tax=Colletotrichum lupini TaxID=145971 RepID=A0A9Q8WHF0_9PEZI|nr:uncharacterized protein CLUP02_09264 [Colletotrichum lupini]UQC83768.1 hypothetical protein CLUP02_09264 [Colletotrichum lupini]
MFPGLPISFINLCPPAALPKSRPPQLSEEEIKQMEAEANFSIQQVVVSAVLLYLSPFVIDAASKVL